MLQRVCGALQRLQAHGVIQAPRLLRFLDGSAWSEEAMADLANAALVLPLLSRTLLDLDRRHPERLTTTIERHQHGLARVLPTIARPCAWRSSRFATLTPLRPIPADEQAL